MELLTSRNHGSLVQTLPTQMVQRSPSHRFRKMDPGGAYVQLKRGALGALWLWHLPVFQEASVVNPGER